MSILFFDTETNGVPAGHFYEQRLVQIAWEYHDEVANHLIRDITHISPKVPHPWTVEACRERGIEFATAFGAFMKALRTCTRVVAHNLEFDAGALRYELQERGGALSTLVDEFTSLITTKGYCTMQNSTQLCKIPKTGAAARHPGYKYPRLEELHMHLFGNSPAVCLHDAANDVAVLKSCAEALLQPKTVLTASS